MFVNPRGIFEYIFYPLDGNIPRGDHDLCMRCKGKFHHANTIDAKVSKVKPWGRGNPEILCPKNKENREP